MRLIRSLNVNILLIFSCSLLALATSCSSLNQKQLIYTTPERRELLINLPYGQGEEDYKTNLDGASEQLFSYKDGSVVYVSRNTTWPTPNGERVKQSGISASSNQGSSGTDEKGLCWKEIHIEGFIVGYTAVPPSRLRRFDRSLNSIRLKD
ncbi:hypothetical protein LZZ85_21470 [Terrimonas sp. NA20]|uniref:Lipoprotein n=1 Tax=Terrimonas ginsenosidimutans TaxID=2908004 RepID=A0ABS9KX12_9BACT|nr:hypothetical protein [Terrimonas ginsenosidimutans]MCG2616881.1 hypothetical protein [Terrimonas ginsenosidimutans]